MRDDLPVRQVDQRMLGVNLPDRTRKKLRVADELVGQRLEHLADELAVLARLDVDFAALSPWPLVAVRLVALQRRRAKSW